MVDVECSRNKFSTMMEVANSVAHAASGYNIIAVVHALVSNLLQECIRDSEYASTYSSQQLH